MKASENIKNLIKSWESCKLTAYKCSAGVNTIGYGHTKGVTPGMKITQAQADKFFDEDIKVFEDFINRMNLKINQNQFDALLSLCYNIGTGNFAKSTLLKKVKANPSDSTIANEFASWRKAGGKIMQALVKRRQKESEIYFS